MTIRYENGRVHIKSDVGKCMKSKYNDTIFVEAWLAIGDTIDNWEEIDYAPDVAEEK